MAAKRQTRRVETDAANGLLKVGDRVRIRNYGGQQGEIVEFRGPLGPGGARIYRVLVRRKPKRDYIELREDQLELIKAGS
jgi:hypothetical protein